MVWAIQQYVDGHTCELSYLTVTLVPPASAPQSFEGKRNVLRLDWFKLPGLSLTFCCINSSIAFVTGQGASSCCRPLNCCVMLLTQCYAKILMFFQSQKYESFIKYLTKSKILRSSVKQNYLSLYTVMKEESFLNFISFTYCSFGHTWYSAWPTEQKLHVKQTIFLSV